MDCHMKGAHVIVMSRPGRISSFCGDLIKPSPDFTLCRTAYGFVSCVFRLPNYPPTVQCYIRTFNLNIEFNSSSPSFYFSVWYLTLSYFPGTWSHKVGDEEAQNVPLHRFDIKDTYKKVVAVSLSHQMYN
ncbi:hypothetical protein J6590_088975 [Homalodisca vitripennis]|nr:hypothetical protein J6590_072583 [Homalodisca vitripennis]KAG8275309.1 hypothetical protein J6590_088975 [Homalodisca vitripennis]